jgi:hypothetical protein
MQHAAKAYGSVATLVANQRELEADLLLKAATRLQAILAIHRVQRYLTRLV